MHWKQRNSAHPSAWGAFSWSLAMALTAAVLLLGSALPKAQAGFAVDIAPSPLEQEHMVILRPEAARLLSGDSARSAEEEAAQFAGVAAVLDEPVAIPVRVRYAGVYTLWLRVGQRPGKQTPVRATLRKTIGNLLWGDAAPAAAAAAIAGPCNSGLGSVAQGGQAAFAEYRKQAQINTPAGSGAHLDSGKTDLGGRGAAADDASAELMSELEGDLQKGTTAQWINLSRLETVDSACPFYWWKVGQAQLAPGNYELLLEPEGAPAGSGKAVLAPDKIATPLLDAGLLTTAGKLVYPYIGDINIAPATFVRFRLDKLPPQGVLLQASVGTHGLPNHTVYPNFGPTGYADEPHLKTGLTRWYRLQDVQYMSPFTSILGGYSGRLEFPLDVKDPKTREILWNVPGATQFANFPHKDYIAREFSWSEPCGRKYTVPLDCQTHLYMLESTRDAARRHYRMALQAAGDKLVPLTRGPLWFMNALGYTQGPDLDYFVKTTRLLGFNSVTESQDPLRSRANYGWECEEGGAAIEVCMPFDDDVAAKFYEAEAKKYITPERQEFFSHVPVRYMVDEPGESYRTEMSGPLWRYRKDPAGDFWIDPVGGSCLRTKNLELTDCVLEGEFERLGNSVRFEVGVDKADKPSHYFHFNVIDQRPPYTTNFASGEFKEGEVDRPRAQTLKEVGKSEGRLRFKIVYEKGSAMFWLGDDSLAQLPGLPEKGGFGISGDRKKIFSVRLRPIRDKERIQLDLAAGATLGKSGAGEDVDLGELGETGGGEWSAQKPLQQFIEQDWVIGGGVPGAQEGFRKWMAAKGVTPELFGEKSWDRVNMLTVNSVVESPADARKYYWGRRYSGYLTPRMFYLSAKAISDAAPKPILNGADLSGGTITASNEMSVDMFEMANQGYPMAPGISDWLFYSTWRRDSLQQVAYHVAPFNAGARRYGQQPVSFPLMHCVAPNVYRAYTELGNQVKSMSMYGFGPLYSTIGDAWSEWYWCYEATSLTTNRAAQCDDILGPGLMRPSRVALLYTHSTEYWDPFSPTSDFLSTAGDRLSTFLGLAHEYYQPELVTEDQVANGALEHYDAVYVLDGWVSRPAQEKIAQFVRAGGLLWASADSLRKDEYNEDADLLKSLAGLERSFTPYLPRTDLLAPLTDNDMIVLKPEAGEKFAPFPVLKMAVPKAITCPQGVVRARYANEVPAWIEVPVGKGKLVYVGHRGGLSYRQHRLMLAGFPTWWADTGRFLLTSPLHEAKIARELSLSEPCIMGQPISTEAGTVVMLYNWKGQPRRNLTIRLREEKAPVSVQYFDGLTLKDIAGQFADGVLSVTLPQLDGGQMLVVRRTAAPADNRLEEIQQRTLAQLGAKEKQELSAGAWFAGFYPQWKLGSKLPGLMAHEHWEVRRAAAESLGRLQEVEASSAIAAAYQKESDDHARAEELEALGKLRHPQAAQFSLKSLSDKSAIVRQSALRGLLASLPPAAGAAADAQTLALYREAITTGLDDEDQRVREQAVNLLFRIDPPLAAGAAVLAYARQDLAGQVDRKLWVQGLVDSDAAFASFLEKELPEGNRPGFKQLLVDLGQKRVDPKLATALAQGALAGWTADINLAIALIHQHDQAATRLLFARRGELKDKLAEYLPLMVEHAFELNLGQGIAQLKALPEAK